MINVISPIISVILVVGVVFIQIFSRVAGNTSFFDTGLLTGVLAIIVVFSVIGQILFFLAMYRLSHYYAEPTIFNKALYGFLVTIVGGIMSAIIEVTYLSTITGRLTSAATTASITPIFSQFFLGFAAIMVVSLIFGIISSILYRQAFNKLGEKSGVENFKTVGLLYVIGVILTVFLVGAILIWVAWIIAAEAYRKLTPKPISDSMAKFPQPPFAGVIYCPYCGTENTSVSVYCRQCGKPLSANQSNV